MQTIDTITYENALEMLGDSVGAMLIADQNADRYRTLVRRGVFQSILNESGTYNDLVQMLWFHFNNSDKRITEEYRVFIPNLSKFIGKYSKRLKLIVEGITHIVQMSIQPINSSGLYLFILDEMGESECEDDAQTQQKVSTIQNTYLFSMCFDLVRNTTSSLSLTEVSDETMNSQISYSEWRQMIAKMIWEDDRKLFEERSDPAYLRAHFRPGQIESFDCQMRNLDGVFIWVKLIFSRMDTTNEDDFRFVYMVQNIHESTVDLRAALKRYEDLASQDSLTQIYNHGRIETEICNAIEQYRKNGTAFAMLMIDIDYFKQVNDHYGHSVGDKTLIHFTDTVCNTLDGRNAAFGRWGGEEFIVILYGAERADAEQAAEQIRSRVAAEMFPVVCTVTCSIGVSTLTPGDDFDSIFTRADGALYSAKQDGRNCVRVNYKE